ncbi:hypothetical protein BAUCODRAFT_315415 [Baudoinia panamericana UAMH 10762]|uniref:Transcription factor domain-containing protein n=1 Tax=Baudoinia panamericana (strain UAMH 10762) TaxID=717646 RepID=M2MIM5_BAUPA|nr:uncharacterized protein BAUCODRAFT_315415 [Baudoinia panamericana UAMH 10762]EMC91118.1 hypothetical protein BAUCODRAFT_315415 [Baudoinia panamericana UAMH 10762]
MATRRVAEVSKGQPSGSRAATPALSRSETSSGSKPSTPGEPTRNQIDFQFLNFSHPSDAKASRARRTVRSHVTRQQHQREQRLQQERRARSYQGPSTETDAPPLQRAHAEIFPLQRPTILELPSPTATRPPLASSPEASSASPSPTTSPTDPFERRIEPSEVYPEEWLPSVPRVMDYYLSIVSIDIPDLEDSEAAGLLRTRFFPFVMTDPAPLHAVMLMAASHYSRICEPRALTIDLLQLRGMAIREINRALEDPLRARSDQLIAAVAKMACYEALFGDRAIFNTHMTGLLRLVSLRGGLPALGLDGLLERILLWIDANATHIVGTHLYFDKQAFPTSAVHPRPGLQRFTCGVLQE